jgi:hypothetical protein
MSLLRKCLISKEVILVDHDKKRPQVVDKTNKEEYTSWLSDKIQIENDINDLKKRIRWQEKSNRAIPSIFTTLFIDPVILDINNEDEFELLKLYESMKLQERSDLIKTWIIAGFIQHKQSKQSEQA